MVRQFLFFLLMLLSGFLHAQQGNISGIVTDSATSQPLAFVNIVTSTAHTGCMTDIDGRFTCIVQSFPCKLTFSYVGYKQTDSVFLTNPGRLHIKMATAPTKLSEVVIPAGVNPALIIIENAINHKTENNPYNIPSYTFTSYDKMVFTVDTDQTDTIQRAAVDSASLRLKQALENQHLFLMETVAEHQYLFPGKAQDKIVATRISGFRDLLFIFLISQMQSSSFYEDQIAIAGTSYINPVSKGAAAFYHYALSDTLINPNDTVFVIRFKPREGKNADLLKGMVYISTNRWAIANVIAEPGRDDVKIGMKIQQMYAFINSKQWFPVQLNTEVRLNNVNTNGATPIGYGKSYRSNIQLNADVNRREISNIVVDVVPDAARQPDTLWRHYRVDSLTRRELNTYRILDSLGKANNFDARIKGLSAFVSGKIPMGPLDFDLNRLMRYSTFEGFYLGAGLHTSERFSQRLTFGGYTGFGFRDKDLKYGADASIKLQKYGNTSLSARYYYDLDEAGGTSFFDDEISVFTSENYRRFYVTRMDRTELAESMLGFRILQFVRGAIGVSRKHKVSAFDYQYEQAEGDPSVWTNDHIFGNVIAGLKIAWGEKFIRNNEKKLSMGTRYPVFWLQFTGSRKGFLGGGFRYNRFDARLRFSFVSRLAGKTSIQLSGGLVDRSAPYSELLNGYGSRASTISVYAHSSFATMRTDEFLNDRFGAVFITHNFGKLLLRSGNFEPEFAIVLNAGAGSLKQPERHRYAPFSTMEKGYYETGILINNLLNSPVAGLGIGLFYRLGPYSFNETARNLTIKLTLSGKL